MDLVPILGRGFSAYLPIVLVVFVFFTLFDVYDRCMGKIGIDRFRFQGDDFSDGFVIYIYLYVFLYFLFCLMFMIDVWRRLVLIDFVFKEIGLLFFYREIVSYF